jgi:hypothetical protein
VPLEAPADGGIGEAEGEGRHTDKLEGPGRVCDADAFTVWVYGGRLSVGGGWSNFRE